MKVLAAIRSKMAVLGYDSLFVSGQENVCYLTGVSGLNTGEREVFLLITGNNSYLFAFATTYLMYKSVTDFKPVEISVNLRLYVALNRIIKQEKLKKMAFESDFVSYSEYAGLKNKVETYLTPTQNIVDSFRLIKTESEIAKIRKAAEITDRAFEFIQTEIRNGISEKEIALKIEYFIRNKADNVSFAPIIAFNGNAAIPHYLPSPNVKLRNHSLILLDIGAKYRNYCADLSRVIFFGKPQEKYLEIYKAVKTSQEKAIAGLKTGIKMELIDKIARQSIVSAGFPEYSHGLGHGVGLAIHEAPRLRPETEDTLAENMVFTVEPGIYLEGFAGVRIEDLLVLRKDGPEMLSNSSKEIIIL